MVLRRCNSLINISPVKVYADCGNNKPVYEIPILALKIIIYHNRVGY